MQKTHQHGFTLVELMVAISVVALLSSVAMYSTAQARAKADDAKKRAEVGQVQVALALHKESVGRVPYNYSCSGEYCTSGGVGVGDGVALEGSQAYDASMRELVARGHLSAIPKSRDGSYVYYADATAQRAVFGAPLKGTTASVTSNNYCPSSPAPYEDCRMTLGNQNSQTPPTPYYTGSDAVNFYVPPVPATFDFYYVRPENDVQRFCKIYGASLCNPGANDLYVNGGQGCPQAMLAFGQPGQYVCLFPSYNAVLSCKLKTGAIATCSGAGRDRCACAE